MNYIISIANKILILLSFLTTVVLSTKPVQFLNGGYRGIVVAIHSDVPESEQLLNNLEELLRKSSEFLYKATEGRARFVEIEVIIPESWSQKDDYESIAGSYYDRSHIRISPTDPVTGDEPYTYQPRGCGQPGEYIRLTDAFIEELKGRTQENFEYPEKHLIHEWAHYRYGVFDEYGIPGDPKYPTFYMENGTVYPTSCVKGIKGRQEDIEGKPCRIYSGGRVDPNCQFIPDKLDNDAMASIMFMPHIKSIEKFCQKGNDPKLAHNQFAPNKQNILCNYRSTSEVIEEHPDFRNLNTSALSDKYYEPVVRFLRIDGQQSSRFVLVLDVSGSMRDNGRIKLLHRSATRLVKDLIPNGMELGIIEFATKAAVVHKMVRINETTRQSLAQVIPQYAEGWTAIGKGFKLALEILRENGGDTRGATIILVSDGEENQDQPTIEEIMPEVLSEGIKVDSIAVAVEADKRLENISSISGGRCFYMKDRDDATNTVMETAFMGFVSQQSDIEIQSVTILSRELTIIGDQRVHKKVIIDSELGKNTKFSIATNDVDVVLVSFRAPDGNVFHEGHPYYKKESHLKHIELWVPDSQPGLWEVYFDKDVRHRPDIIVSLTVTSEPKNPKQQPIRVNTYFGKLEVRYPATALIYAEVKKGENAIIGANVVATVERPQDGNVDVVLVDDGSGFDVSANDGVYTTAFTQFTESGRYSVSAKVTSVPSKTRVRTTRSHYAYSRSSRAVKSLRKGYNDLKNQFDVTDFISVSGKPTETIESEATAEFSRVSEAGAFKVEGYVQNVDLMAPGRVTNLQVITTDEDDQIVELQWSAPGDDAFTGNATNIDLRVSLSQQTLHSPNLFSTAVPIFEDILIAGSLEPREGGSTMRAKFQIPRLMLKFGEMSLSSNNGPKISVYFALRATDESNNTGDISNIAFVHFGYVKPVFDNIIIGTNSRPFETTVLQTHVVLENPVLFYHNRILLQKPKNQIYVRIPKELGRNTKFIITSDDIETLNLRLVSPNGTIYTVNSYTYWFNPSEMVVEFQIPLSHPGKWKVRIDKRRKETVIAYLSVTSESKVDEPIKVRAWMDTPFMAEDKPPTAVVNAEVTKRYNYLICADVIAVVDRPKGEPILIQLHDNGLGADKVPNDGIYSGIFAKFNTNGRYGVNARVINNNKAMLKLGVEDEKLKCH